MRSGAHDMKVFGSGALAALSSRQRAAAFFHGHYHVYSAMERHLDACDAATPTGALWQRVGSSLRRGAALEQDVLSLGGQPEEALSPATESYVRRLATAASSPLPLLLSHFYGALLHAPGLYAAPALTLSLQCGISLTSSVAQCWGAPRARLSCCRARRHSTCTTRP
jgi:hypothetical protein